MYLCFHLFTAILLGIILALILKNKWAIIWCGFGGLLPDLLDKSLGHFAFFEAVGTEHRLYAHTLIFLFVLLITGIILFCKNKKYIALLAASIGVFIHHLGDSMWTQPLVWYWPLKGNILSSETVQTIQTNPKSLLISICILELIVFAIFYFPFIRKKQLKIQIAAIATFLACGLITLAGGLFLIYGNILTIANTGNIGYLIKIIGQETSMMSEWIFGVASLILIILVMATEIPRLKEFFLSGDRDKFPRLKNCRPRTAILFARTTGCACIAAAVLYSLLLFCSIPIDARYSLMHHTWVAAALFAGGILITLAAKKLFSSPDKSARF